MSTENLYTYLEKTLEETMGEYEFALDWSKKDRTIKTSIRLFAENPHNIDFEDKHAIVSKEGVIEFEDSAIFYGKSKETSIKQEDYLVTIPFDEKIGLEKGVVDAFANSLKDMMDEGQSDLLQFIEESSLVMGLDGLTDDQIKIYFNELSAPAQETLLNALDKEELTFHLHFDQSAFETLKQENLNTEDGKVMLDYPLY
ncbi:MAG: DUF3013 family protein [Streptococcaceae bacterium]|nr:DUF3013 family protein [Streptococcaceae bacterium]